MQSRWLGTKNVLKAQCLYWYSNDYIEFLGSDVFVFVSACQTSPNLSGMTDKLSSPQGRKSAQPTLREHDIYKLILTNTGYSVLILVEFEGLDKPVKYNRPRTNGTINGNLKSTMFSTVL